MKHIQEVWEYCELLAVSRVVKLLMGTQGVELTSDQLPYFVESARIEVVWKTQLPTQEQQETHIGTPT